MDISKNNFSRSSSRRLRAPTRHITSTVFALTVLALSAAAKAPRGITIYLPNGSGVAERNVARLAARGDFEQALREIDVKAATPKDRARSLILKAQIEEAQDETELAAADIEAAWKTGTLDNDALVWAVADLHRISNGNACLEMCNKLITSKKTVEAASGYFVKARMYANKGNNAEAIKNYEASMKLNPYDARAFLECGGVYIAIQKYEQAIKAESTGLNLIKGDPGYRATVGALQNRALAYSKLKRYKEALADYDLAIKYRPLIRELFIGRAEVYRALGDKKKEAADLASLKSLDNGY